MELYDRVGIVHLPGGAGGEHIGIVRVPCVFLKEQIHRFLGNGYTPHGSLCLRPGEDHLAIWVADVLLADRDGAVSYIQVVPAESDQLALAETAHQFQIEHRQGVVLFRSGEVCADILRLEDIHFHLSDLGGDAVIGRIAEDQPLLDRPLQGYVEHEVDAACSGGTEPLVSFFAGADPAMCSQILVELLEVAGGQLGEFNAADVGNDVTVDIKFVTVGGGQTDVGLCVEAYQVWSQVATV